MKYFVFGHKAEFDEDKQILQFCDNGEIIPRGSKIKRPCPKCQKMMTPDGHDPCIANLPGVKFACCGHGVTEGYIAFENGCVVRGMFDISWPDISSWKD